MTSRSRRLDALRQSACALTPEVARLAVRIAEVPAPTGEEQARALLVRDLLIQRGYPAEIDGLGNVYARRGSRGGPLMMLAAHTDTVFPRDTPLRISQTRGRLTGPGVGDNSLGVAALLGVLDLLDQMEASTELDLIAVATVGEEGLGNLAGARAAVDRYQADLRAFVAVEGHNLGRVTLAGIGSLRWRINVHGPGGHSWGAFGQPSAIHGLAHIIASICELQPPVHPKTTFNVGVIDGGMSVNTIAPDATALIDIRSVDAATLNRFAERIRKTILAGNRDGLHVAIETLGERPAGESDREHPLVAAGARALRDLGIEPIFDASSTDANIAMSRGIPAICLGVSRGGSGHTIEEFIDVAPIADGLTQLAAVVIDGTAALAGETR